MIEVTNPTTEITHVIHIPLKDLIKQHVRITLKKGDAKGYVAYGIGGILFMIFALCMGACPYRLALRIGYGDLVAVFGLIAIIIGVLIGIKIALKRMEA